MINRIKQASAIVRRMKLERKGYSKYAINHLLADYEKGCKNSTLPEETKKWAHDRRFYPWRVEQYGLTEDNYKTIISDKDYCYLYPLNNRYRIWIDDKLTMKYVLAPFDRFLPKYYYHLMKDRGAMRLMDCPSGFDPGYDGMIALLREKKNLAAKLTAGSCGVGFYKFEAEEDHFLVNGKTKTEEEFRAFLGSLSDYIITEFVKNHPALDKLNPYSVNTIRAMVINKTGNDPILPFVYFRIGTKQSGIVDNVSQGGMVCRVDVDTGRFYDGKTVKNHVFEDVEYHPDTHEKLEGFLPNWELVKSSLLEISAYCPELTWLGYDIAITADGFKIIEINSHQGLHRAHEYPKEVSAFLMEELKKKKERYHQPE